MSAHTLEKILQAVNEKYGTSFEGWSQLPTAYEVGDTVPNWSAYEKIEMPKYLKFPVASGVRVVTAAIIDDIFRLMVRGSGEDFGALYVSASSGKVYELTFALSVQESFYNAALALYPGISLGPYLETTYVPGDIIDIASYVQV